MFVFVLSSAVFTDNILTHKSLVHQSHIIKQAIWHQQSQTRALVFSHYKKWISSTDLEKSGYCCPTWEALRGIKEQKGCQSKNRYFNNCLASSGQSFKYVVVKPACNVSAHQVYENQGRSSFWFKTKCFLVAGNLFWGSKGHLKYSNS